MTAVIFVCMAVGVDIPHIDQADAKIAFEKVMGNELPKDYLKLFELGQALAASPVTYSTHFSNTFGDKFGAALFVACGKMLQLEPGKRPPPGSVVGALRQLQ
jgi:hypothetical protein